jgi:hypothetical protein
MPQIFPRYSNTLARVVILGGLGTALGIVGVFWMLMRSPFQTNVGVVRDQPVPFSHEHHVRGLGIDCRYCHNAVEDSEHSNVPPTYTCMSCHSQIWSDSPMLAPVRDSLKSGKPLVWSRLHDLPDFVYFNHGIHVNKGVGCATCHGRIDLMPLTFKDQPMTMEWCLECHRHPERHLRPTSEITNMDYKPEGGDQLEVGRKLVDQYHIPTDRLTNCSVCHR